MLICIFTICMLICMKQLPRPLQPLGEDELAHQAPLIRAFVAQGLLEVWNTCQPHVNGTAERVDVRFVEAGLRALDRIGRLFRLDQPAAPVVDPDARPVDAATIVENGLRELESRLRG